MKLSNYSFGTGDRFGQEGQAQLRAVQKAQNKLGAPITPVWNKSNREHEIIGTNPSDVRREADEAAHKLQWSDAYFVDADHITQVTVDPYLGCSNFFTLDVAEFISQPCEAATKKDFIERQNSWIGEISIPGIDKEIIVTKDFLKNWADQYLKAIRKAAELYKYIRSKKKADEEVVYEISIDEVKTPQTPVELFLFLKPLLIVASTSILLHLNLQAISIKALIMWAMLISLPKSSRRICW